jgi:hypothetical protein
MLEHRTVSLTTISQPVTGPLVSAPPILEASLDTIDFICEKCGTVLLHADDGQVHNLHISMHKVRLV